MEIRVSFRQQGDRPLKYTNLYLSIYTLLTADKSLLIWSTGQCERRRHFTGRRKQNTTSSSLFSSTNCTLCHRN